MKRLPPNTNLKLFTEAFYNGLPVITNHGPLIENYLVKIDSTLGLALHYHPRTLMIRFDLHQPESIIGYDADVISRFFKYLNQEINKDQESKRLEGGKVRKCDLRYVWAKERARLTSPPHYHVAIFLNRDCYHTLGSFESSAGTMKSRIENAWIKALSLNPFEIRGLIDFPKNSTYKLNRNSSNFANQLDDAFFRLSYFAKAETKLYRDRTRWFGSSYK